jgi:indolepyruvate ferredoxin oxidoreductase beta subunit
VTQQSCNIIIAGVGGQGTVLASKLLAQAALLEGYPVRTAETIGMAQRGGSVLGHVRIGETLSPLVPQKTADLLIGFEPGEAVRALGYLKRGGTVVTATQVLEPPSAALSNASYDGSAELAYLRAEQANGRLGALVAVDGTALCAELGSTRVLNVILLGAALSTGDIGLTASTLEAAIEALVKPNYVELNRRALARGMRSTQPTAATREQL